MRPLLLFALMTACASPSLEFRGATKTEITLSGDRITVFRKGDRVQAVRTNYRQKSQRKFGQERLVLAIEAATGCAVKPRSVKGDIVLVTARLDCP